MQGKISTGDQSLVSLLSVNQYKTDKKTPGTGTKQNPTSIKVIAQKSETETPAIAASWFNNYGCCNLPTEKGNLSLRIMQTTQGDTRSVKLQTNRSQAILPCVHTGDELPDFEGEEMED